MNKNERLKITVWILAALAVIEAFILVTIWVSRPKPKKVLPPIPVPTVTVGKIAIVLDDWGYNLNNLHTLREIKAPLTLSVLPNLGYSRKIAEEGNSLGFEVILHLPCQPNETRALEKNTILTSMDNQTIRSIVNQDLDDIVYAKGLSNHMGSKVTEDRRVMGIILGELKNRHLYFLDSWVSPNTVGLEVARQMKLKAGRRDVFLDNKEEPEYIKAQLYKLMKKAKAYGQAIGIGHDRKVTLEVLQEAIPEMENKGFKIVPVSELVK